jgi:hypothetical protein
MGLDTSGKRHCRILSLFLGSFLFIPQAKVHKGIIMKFKKWLSEAKWCFAAKIFFYKRTESKPVNKIA